MERASFCRLVCYLCPKLTEADIPKRTCMGDAILEKVERLDDIDLKILDVSSYFNHLSIVSLLCECADFIAWWGVSVLLVTYELVFISN